MYAHVYSRSNKHEETKPRIAFRLPLCLLENSRFAHRFVALLYVLQLHLDSSIDNSIITIIITVLSMSLTMMMPQLQESEEEKKEEGEKAAEKKDDSIVYADLDKSAMSEGDDVNNVDLKMLIMIVTMKGSPHYIVY